MGGQDKLLELLARALAKQDEQNQELQRINVTLAEQHGTLREHMRRSEANERALEVVREELRAHQQASRESVAALQEALTGLAHASVTWAKLGKLLAACGTVAGLVKVFGG